VNEAGPMRLAFEAGSTKKEAGALGKRPGPGQGLDAGSRGKESGPRSQDQLQTQPGPMDPMRREGTATPGREVELAMCNKKTYICP